MRPNQGDIQGESFKGVFRGGLLRKLEYFNSNFKGEQKVKDSIKDLIKNSSLLTRFSLHFTTMIF